MQVQADIKIDDLLRIIETLSDEHLKLLRAEIEKRFQAKRYKPEDLEALLLNGPIATKKQLKVIEKNRKAINRWRTE